MSVIPRPTSLDAASRTPHAAAANDCDSLPGRLASELLGLDLRFGISTGGLSRSGLVEELQPRSVASERTAPRPVAMRISVRRDGTGGTGDTRGIREVDGADIAVRGCVEIDLDGRPLGAEAASFTIVGGLRGVLTRGDRHLHLDLADDAGPWLRCSVPVPSGRDARGATAVAPHPDTGQGDRESASARLAAVDGPREEVARGMGSERADETPHATPRGADRSAASADVGRTDGTDDRSGDGSYVWLRPMGDWGIPGGTASPREIRATATILNDAAWPNPSDALGDANAAVSASPARTARRIRHADVSCRGAAGS